MAFPACQSWTSHLNPAVPFTLYWNLAATADGTGSVMTAVLDSTIYWTGWIAWGFPQYPETMAGTSAVIAKVDSASPTGRSLPPKISQFATNWVYIDYHLDSKLFSFALHLHL